MEIKTFLKNKEYSIWKEPYMYIIFIISFFIRVVLCLQALPIRTLSDELATISGAAHLAGNDWSNLISQAGYYGVGFTSFLWVFFKVFDNPVYIYRGMLVVYAFIQSLSIPIAFYIMKHYFKIKNNVFVALVSLSSSFFVVTRAMIVYNEHILILISWLITLILFKLMENMDNQRKKRYYTTVLFLILSYSLTIHTRALTFWIAILGIIILYAIWKKRCLISPVICIIIGTIGYISSQIFVKFVQSNIWTSSSGETLRNASVPVSSISFSIFNVENWQAWFGIIIGQLNTINIFSGGILIFLVIVLLALAWAHLKKDNTWDELMKNPIYFHLIIIAIYFVLCIGMTIAAQSISWLPGAANTINAGVLNDEYGSKAFTYIRYIGPYCAPVFLLGSCLIYKMQEYFNKKLLFLYKVSLSIICVLNAIWVTCIVPYFHQSKAINTIEAFVPFALSSSQIEHATLNIILPATLIAFLSFLLYGIFVKKQKPMWIYVYISVFLIYEYAYNALYWDLPTQKGNYEMGKSIESYIRKLENEINLPEMIYVEDIRDKADHQNYYEYQFLLYDYKIKPFKKEKTNISEETEALLITNGNIVENWEYWNELGCKYLNIENSYLLVIGDSLQDRIVDTGIELLQCNTK